MITDFQLFSYYYILLFKKFQQLLVNVLYVIFNSVAEARFKLLPALSYLDNSNSQYTYSVSFLNPLLFNYVNCNRYRKLLLTII